MNKFLLSFVVAISLVFAAPAGAGTVYQDAYFINLDAVTLVQCEGPNGFDGGTGFVIGKNRVVTANHVIKDTTKCTVDDKPATLVSYDTVADMAVLEVDLGEKPPVLQINCDGFVADHLYFALGYAKAEDFAMTKMISTGKFEDFAPDDPNDPINPHMAVLGGLLIGGMSGGPIIDMDGRVVGINSMSNGSTRGFSRALADTKLCDALKKPPAAPLYPVQPKLTPKSMSIEEFLKQFPPLPPAKK